MGNRFLDSSPVGYVLDDNGEPTPCYDIIEWGTFLTDNKNKIVNQTEVGIYWISTVFLGIDHNFSGNGPPILWETMVFNRSIETEMWNGEELE